MLLPPSVMQSVFAFVAQNIGIGKKDRFWKRFFTAMVTGCFVWIVTFQAGFFGGAQLSSVFTQDAEVIAQSADYLRGFSVECILTCILYSYPGICFYVSLTEYFIDAGGSGNSCYECI